MCPVVVQNMMMEKNLGCVWVGIGVNFSPNSMIYQECLRIASLLQRKYKTQPFFSKIRQPHLNIYDLSLPQKNLEIVLKRLDGLLKDQKSLELKIKSVDYFPFGLFFLKVEEKKELIVLHRNIVEIIYALKEDCICEDYSRLLDKYNSNQKDSLERFGNPYVLDLFNPHLAFGFIKDSSLNFDSVKPYLEAKTIIESFRIEKIDVVGENKYHVKKIIKTFNLR